MSRLQGTRAYLIGAIDRRKDGGHGWRDELTPVLEKLGVIVFNPLKKPIDIGLEHDDARAARDKYKKEQNWDALADVMKKVRCVDLRMVDVCDFIVANLDLTEHPCGTYEELFWANREKKPILVYCPQGKGAIPDWLFGAIPHQMMFNKWEDLNAYLFHVAYDAEYNHYKRWFLFNNLVPYSKFSDFSDLKIKSLNSTEFVREDIWELGRQAPYHKDKSEK